MAICLEDYRSLVTVWAVGTLALATFLLLAELAYKRAEKRNREKILRRFLPCR